MKKIIRFAALALTSISFFAVGCAGNAGSSSHSSPSSGDNGNETSGYVDYKLDHGIHEYKVAPTSKKIVENGKTDYKIVIPQNYTKYEFTAMEDFAYFFKEATNIELDYITDAGITYSEQNKYFCIGNVAFLKNSGITISSDLGLSGFKLQTVGCSVYMVGGQYGSLYAAYEYLKWAFDYEYYGLECYKIDRFVTELVLQEFEIKEVPDIMLTDVLSGTSDWNLNHSRRLRETMDTVVGSSHHNAFEYFPTSKYLNQDDIVNFHPEFYSNYDGEQLCYTARGSKESLELMQDIVYNKLITDLKNQPNVPALGFEQRDVNTWCNCVSCKSLNKKYGTDAASQILFMNPVMERVDAWVNENQPGRDYTILLFAYHKTVNAPVKEINGQYVPVDDIKCHKNLGIWYAPIEADFLKPFSDGVNLGIQKNFEKWSLVTDRMYCWFYSLCASNYFTPFNGFDAVQNHYQTAYKYDTYYILDQSRYGAGGRSAWQVLMDYVHIKLMWNVNADMNTLITDFFENYFGDYSDEMREIFNSLRTWMRYIESEKNWGGSSCILSDSMHDNEFWPFGIVNNWVEMYDRVFELLDEIKQDYPTQYEIYYNRISLEAASPQYMIVTKYKAQLSTERYTQIAMRLCNTVDTMQINLVGEHASSADLRANLLG